VTLRDLIEMWLMPARVDFEEDPDQLREENAQAHRDAKDAARHLEQVVRGERVPLYNDFEALTRWVDRRGSPQR
jgi:hypothetical protein